MLAGRTCRGAVTRIDPVATTSGNRALFGVMTSLDDTPAGLRTGMSASLEVVTAQDGDTLYVPAGAVRPESGGVHEPRRACGARPQERGAVFVVSHGCGTATGRVMRNPPVTTNGPAGDPGRAVAAVPHGR